MATENSHCLIYLKNKVKRYFNKKVANSKKEKYASSLCKRYSRKFPPYPMFTNLLVALVEK
jgi:hypothetical protein